MIKLIGLNLLPYREIARQEARNAFNRVLLLVAALGLVLAFAVWIFLGQMVNIQQGRNELLKGKIAELDEQIKQVEELTARKQEFIARKKKIEELQSERYKGAMILNDLNNLMPEGVYLTELSSKAAGEYVLTGKAVSDSKVAVLMRSLPSTGLFTPPDLVSIRTKDGAQEFVLKTTLVQQSDAQQSQTAKAN